MPTQQRAKRGRPHADAHRGARRADGGGGGGHRRAVTGARQARGNWRAPVLAHANWRGALAAALQSRSRRRSPNVRAFLADRRRPLPAAPLAPDANWRGALAAAVQSRSHRRSPRVLFREGACYPQSGATKSPQHRALSAGPQLRAGTCGGNTAERVRVAAPAAAAGHVAGAAPRGAQRREDPNSGADAVGRYAAQAAFKLAGAVPGWIACAAIAAVCCARCCIHTTVIFALDLPCASARRS